VAGSPASSVGFVVVAVLVAVYVTPALVAAARGLPGLVRPALLWSWTGVGWLVVLALALSRHGHRDAQGWTEGSWQ
jgi:hypothetical protein